VGSGAQQTIRIASTPRLLAAVLASLALAGLALAGPAESRAPRAHVAEASHVGWPAITGMTLMDKRNQSRPLDGRPGHDPFDGTDPSYSCDGLHSYTRCGGGTFFMGNGRDVPARCREVIPGASPCPYEYTPGNLVPANIGHNLLLGGNGNNVIHAGPAGDVIWGDYKPSGDPTSQVNHLYGGPGTDWLYAAHGTNYIWTGAGKDHVLLVYGHGVVHCNGPGHKTIVLPKLPQNRHYQLIGCSDATIIPYAV
jgi:hypothetical protein